MWKFRSKDIPVKQNDLRPKPSIWVPLALWFFQNCVFYREEREREKERARKRERERESERKSDPDIRSEDMKILFFNINCFNQCFGFFDISLLQKNWWSQHITDNVSSFYLRPTLNELFSNFIMLYWYLIRSSWNMKVVSNFDYFHKKFHHRCLTRFQIRLFTRLTFASSFQVEELFWSVTLEKCCMLISFTKDFTMVRWEIKLT